MKNKPALSRRPWALSVCQARDTEAKWHVDGAFYSITRTPQELSIVCETACVPPHVKAEHGWISYEVEGPIPLDTVGVMADVSGLMKQAQISIFVLSTYNTDFILLKEADAGKAESAWRQAGYPLV